VARLRSRPVGAARRRAADAAVRAAGEAATAARRDVSSTLARVDAVDGLDEDETAVLKSLGIPLVDPPPAEPLRAAVAEALRSHRRLPRVVSALGLVADLCLPRSTAETLDALDRAVPAGDVERPANVPSLESALRGLTVRPTLVGIAAGLIATLAALPLVGSGRWAAVLGGVLAAAGVAAAMYRSARYRAVSRWTVLAGLGPAAAAVEAMERVLTEVATDDWARADARRRVRSSALSLGDTLAGVGHQLGTLAPSVPDARWTDPERVTPLSEVFVEDYLSLIGRATLVWLDCDLHRPEAAPGAVLDWVEEVVPSYRAHIAANGVLRPPDGYESDSPARTLLRSAGWRAHADELRHWLSTRAIDPLPQLCRPEDLRLLEVSSDTAELVAFAPDTAYPGATPAHVVPTYGRDVAGVVRLVPLRPTAVEPLRAVPALLRPVSGTAGPREQDRGGPPK
ncbi:MAG: hypothetical protein ACRD12_22250, partial [Acidimicrobiales bacterium]